MKAWGIIAALLIVVFAFSCRKEEKPLTMALTDSPYFLELPPGFPEPEIPEDNQLTQLRVALGKRLFFDPGLSRDGTVSCGSCHIQELAFSDGMNLSTGIDGRLGSRNAPALFNLAWHDRLMADGGVPSLELQVMVPIHDEREMDAHILDLSDQLNRDKTYRDLAQAAYGRDIDPFVITRAIAAFERTLVSGNSRFDAYVNGDLTALNQEEIDGMNLFFSERTSCGSCHSGVLLSDNDYHNVGLSQSYTDAGRELITLDPNDNGKFKTPSLRNIALTAPYMHDGSFSTLDEVLEHFIQGGHTHPIKDERIRALDLNNQEKAAIIKFLESLTDDRFIQNQAFWP